MMIQQRINARLQVMFYTVGRALNFPLKEKF